MNILLIKIVRQNKILLVLMLSVMTLLFVNNSMVNTGSSSEPDYKWSSPNNWDGGKFSILSWFAEDLQFTGKEELRFHPGYYDIGSDGFWTYVFVLVVEQVDDVSTDDIVQETKLYFKGLGETLGDHKKQNIAIESIKVKPLSGWKQFNNGEWKAQKYSLTAFDSWETGKPIDLNLNVSTWLCKNTKHRAIVYAITPHAWDNPIWKSLKRESGGLSC